MKRCFALVLLSFFAVARTVCADGLDDQYVQTFNLIQQADALASAEPRTALSKYQEAQTALQRIQKENPNWNSLIVNFRLQYVAGKISELAGKVPRATAAAGTNAPAPRAAGPKPSGEGVAEKATAPQDWEEQMASLRQQVQQLRGQNGELEAKLKEAFAARPPEVDPQEVARLKQSVSQLQKENGLLKVTLSQESPAASARAGKAQNQAEPGLAEANRQLAEARQENAKLESQAQALEAQLRAMGGGEGAGSQLRADNQRLREQLAALKGSGSRGQSEPAFTPLPGSARTGSASAQAPVSESKRVRQLERERDELQKRLEAADKALAGHKGKDNGNREELAQLLETARTRLAVYEARAVPYTPQELALMKAPTAALPAAQGENAPQSVRQLSPDAAKLVTQGRRYYQAGDFDRAEAAYTQALQEAPNNVAVLTDLASIQVRANHLEPAESRINQALKLAPDSVYALSVLGRLRLEQGRYDEALDALGRAAKMAPNDAEIQNFLGLALSHKGLRVQAENAFRKAIELQPDYAEAHNNLALVYITAKPPAVALAKWHYQHALSAGGQRNPELEKLLQTTR